jgi:hypothetical protein
MPAVTTGAGIWIRQALIRYGGEWSNHFSNRNRHVMRVLRLRYLIDGAIANRASADAQFCGSEPPMIGHDLGRPRRNIAPAAAAKGRLASGAGPL